ncbi:MAG: hypothetical protein GH143_05780 [Calditrichaeota bacterium]|nr:hypothetical protein [Calditrichota bacterium]
MDRLFRGCGSLNVHSETDRKYIDRTNLKRSRYHRKFARISRKLRDYPRGRSSQLGEWDLFEDLTSGSSSSLFLGVYGDLAIMDLLGEYGLLDALAEQGIGHPLLDLELSDAYRHILRLYDGEITPGRLLAELVFRRTLLSRTLPGGIHSDEPVAENNRHPCLHLEWILLQNPHRRFDGDHPALPQQEHPGLALGGMVLSLIAQMARVLRMSGVVTVPANLHSALFFLRYYLALSPGIQAELLALKRVAKRFGRAEVAWGEQWGDLLEHDTGRPYRWRPSEMVQPLNDELHAWFKGNERYMREMERSQPRFIIRKGVRVRSLADGQVVRDYKTQRFPRKLVA